MWYIYIPVTIYICIYAYGFYWGHLRSFQEVDGDEFYVLSSSYKMKTQSTFELFKNMKYFYVNMGSKGTPGLKQQRKRVGRCPQSSCPKRGTLGMMAGVTLAG